MRTGAVRVISQKESRGPSVPGFLPLPIAAVGYFGALPVTTGVSTARFHSKNEPSYIATS